MRHPDISAACFCGDHKGCTFPKCRCLCHQPPVPSVEGLFDTRSSDPCPWDIYQEPAPYQATPAYKEPTMRMTIEATDQLTTMDGVPVRLWEGTTEAGTPCKVFVHRIAVHKSQDAAQFDKELKEQLPPGRSVPLSAIL